MTPSSLPSSRVSTEPSTVQPPNFDADLYKQRNVVERSFALLKQWRALATRYDKHATIYRGAAVIAAILTWLRS